MRDDFSVKAFTHNEVQHSGVISTSGHKGKAGTKKRHLRSPTVRENEMPRTAHLACLGSCDFVLIPQEIFP